MTHELTGDCIFVNGIEFRGYHGILPEERRTGGRYRVDLAVQWPMDRAIRSDKIADTIDYRALCAIVLRRGTGRRCNLIEKLAAGIADDILNETPVTACSVTLHKYPPDLAASSVTVKITRHRRDSGEKPDGPS